MGVFHEFVLPSILNTVLYCHTVYGLSRVHTIMVPLCTVEYSPRLILRIESYICNWSGHDTFENNLRYISSSHVKR